LVYDQSSSVDVCLRDQKSLCIAVLICATVVNTQADRQLLTGCTISSTN